MTGIITALIGMVGSAFGALVGVLANSKMINYRLEQLENRVQAHNNLIDRMYKVERDNELIEEKLKVANHRIDDLERGGSTMSKNWLRCAGIRALKTTAQTAIAMIGTAVLLSQVDWTTVVSASVLAGVLSMLTSLAGLPECEESENG